MGFNMISSIKQLSPILVILVWVTLLQAQRNEYMGEVEAPLNCIPAEQSRNGDTIMVTYKGFLADGKVFDTNQGKDPISFKLGAGKVIKGQDNKRRNRERKWKVQRIKNHTERRQ